MTSYTAAIGTNRRVTSTEFCDVTVIEEDAFGNLTDKVAFTADTAIRTDHEDVLGVVQADAERVLDGNGWRVAGDWRVADDALYAPVVLKGLTSHQLAARLLELPDLPVYHDPDMVRPEMDLLHEIREASHLRNGQYSRVVLD